jgi:uncharacterized protein (DUF1778 family)
MERTYRADVQYLIRILTAADVRATSDLDTVLEVVLREATQVVEIYHFRVDDQCERNRGGELRQN